MTELPYNFWPLARKLASYAAQAYGSATISDPATNAAAQVSLDENNEIIVAFKGSSSAKDFIQDAEFWMEKLIVLNGGEEVFVHHGFLQDFNAISTAVVNEVKTLLALHPTARIFLTGHSLGGALAKLAALEFSRVKLPLAAVVTFGSPRVGDKNFVALYEAALGGITFRIVNENDIVPRTPGVLFGYRHPVNEVFLQDHEFNLAPTLNPSLWWKAGVDALGLWGAYRFRQDVLVREHFINSYQEAIRNL